MKLRKRKSIIIIPTMIIVALIGFGLINNGGNEFVKSVWMSFATNSPDDTNEPPGSGSEQPEKPDTEEPGKPGAGKPDTEEPGKPDTKQPEVVDPELPNPVIDGQPNEGQQPAGSVIYVNQQLLIPNYGEPATLESKVINAGINSSSSKQIALTFDAGWLYDQTLDLLNVLDQYDVKATFFLRAQWVKDNQWLAKEIYKRGHSVENHSLTHGHMKEMTDSEVLNEMVTSTNIIKEITGYRPYLFRPPFGEYDNRILKILAEQGYPYTVKWTVDSLDWAENLRGVEITEQYLIDRILNNASNNGIVLMHVGGYQTVKALPEIIDGLRNDGYKLVKVNDMLPKNTNSFESKYTVKQGDTLTSIAKKYGTSVKAIIELNNIK